MALTVTGLDNASFNPANNPMIYTLSSTNTGQSNFRYIADVYINGASTYNRIEVVANPTYSSGVVDVSGIVQAALTSNNADNTSTFNTNDGHLCEFTIQFGEQYGASSGITTYPNLDSKSAYAYNGVFDPISFLSYAQRDYIINDSASGFLTDCPLFQITETEQLCISFLNQTTNQGTYLEVSSYEPDGSFADTVRILNPFNTVNSNARRSVQMNISFAWLNSLVTADFTTGTAPFLLSPGSYTIRMLDSASAVSSETITVYMVDQCTKTTPIRFKFLNNYGTYDYFTFLGTTKKKSDINRKNFKSNNYDWSSSGYSTNSKSRGTTQFETTLNDAVTVNSSWITAAQSVWLEQLVSSPDVYIYQGSNLVSVNIIDGVYEPKQEETDQLFELSVTYRPSYNRTRQRR